MTMMSLAPFTFFRVQIDTKTVRLDSLRPGMIELSFATMMFAE
jgi:hypothetical protein